MQLQFYFFSPFRQGTYISLLCEAYNKTFIILRGLKYDALAVEFESFQLESQKT